VFEVSPLTLDVYMPASKIVTLRPLGREMWVGGAGRRSYFMTMGVELRVFYNARRRLPNLTVGLKAYVPILTDANRSAGSAHRAGIGVSIGHRINGRAPRRSRCSRWTFTVGRQALTRPAERQHGRPPSLPEAVPQQIPVVQPREKRDGLGGARP
jgi:hypothetical protein